MDLSPTSSRLLAGAATHRASGEPASNGPTSSGSTFSGSWGSTAVGAARAGGSRPTWPLWVVAGIAGWAGVVSLGAQLYALTPPRAGFDLELLLEAGRRVAGGATPYDPAMLAGGSPTAVDLFYSYPPPVAQYLSLFAAIPSPVMLVVWGITAAFGLVAVAVALARHTQAGRRAASRGETLRTVGLPMLALAPLIFPFAIATLFGNLDALFPLLYGVMLLGALGTAVPARFGGGAALAIAGIAKLHPATMGLWFMARGFRDRRRAATATATPTRGRTPARAGVARAIPGPWIVAAAATAVGLVILVVSVAAGGTAPWLDYLTVLRSSAAADVVDPRNIGPAAQVALLTGGGESLARLLQAGVTIAALAGTVAAAWWRDDTLESFALATVASLIILPIAWFHYPVALIPVALAAWLRAEPAQRRRVTTLLAIAMIVGVLTVAAPVFVWCSVGLVLVAVRQSLPIPPPTMPFPALEPSRIRRFPVPGERV